MKRILVLLMIWISSCSEDNEVITCDNFSIRLSELEYADCRGSNGNLTITASGGKEPYLYRINDGTPQASNVFTDLDPQYYSIVVEDANGCIDSVRTFIGGVQAVKAVALTTNAGCGGSNGSLEIIAKNGIEPYRYQLGENAEYTFENTFTGLSAGAYSVWVKDDRDCFLGIYPVVLNGIDTEDIMPILSDNCISSGCHDAANELDLSQEEEAEKVATDVLDIGRSEDHYSPKLPLSQLDSLVCWVQDVELQDN